MSNTMKNTRSSDFYIKQQRMRILIVDDEKDFARGLSRLISSQFSDLDIAVACSGAEALRFMADNIVHLMITDLRMPEMSGMQLLEEVLKIQAEVSMVVLSAYGTIETAVQSLQLGAVSEAARISGLSRVALQKMIIRVGEDAAKYRD